MQATLRMYLRSCVSQMKVSSDNSFGASVMVKLMVVCCICKAINQKFENLEWEQAIRFAHGMQSDDPSHRWALENEPEVKARNRYINVQAWANSRIHLKVPEGECDFINASPIVLKDSTTQTERRYIATQVSNMNFHFGVMKENTHLTSIL